jgi:ferritin-like metal-binding protein YciE
MESLRDVLIEELKDLYDAEKQLVKALPKMVKAASNEELKEAFESHLEETKGHVERLEQAFQLLEQKAKSKPCEAMKGLISEGQQTMQEDFSEPLLDSAIICAAQKVEHYEIAGYGTVCAWARSMSLEDVADLLDQTLAEEKAADEKLTEVAGDVMSEAQAAEFAEEVEGETVDAGSAPRKGAGNRGAASESKSRRRAV